MVEQDAGRLEALAVLCKHRLSFLSFYAEEEEGLTGAERGKQKVKVTPPVLIHGREELELLSVGGRGE